MTRTLLTTCILVLVAALFAWSEGGRVGMGALIGGLGGAAVASACVGWQRRVARSRPQHALNLSVLAFLIYLGGAVLGATLFRFVETAAAGADWAALLVAYGLAVFGVMTVGAFDVARALRAPGKVPQDGIAEGVEA